MPASLGEPIGGDFDALRQGGVDLLRGLNGLALFDTHEPVDPAVPLTGYLTIAGVEAARGPGRVSALQVLGGALYVNGTFDTAGGAPSCSIARFRR